MEDTAHRAIAIVGVGAVLPDAVSAAAFWENVKSGRYSITEVTPDRWDPALYYDPDPAAPDKAYSKIGGWVRECTWDPMKWRLPVPPRVADAMDDAQKWAVACTRQALDDYGYPNRPLNTDRTAVILGNAMAGEKHYMTALRLYFPEILQELSGVSEFTALPASLQRDITSKLHERIRKHFPEVTEDTMPGELANCMAGRIANLFNFHGPNYVADAACASAMAAISAAVEGLIENDFDVAVTGGVDRNMGASTFIKFCKIGALSATGTRPYAEGADGFVMGEGSAIFIMKRLADAEQAGDKIYAVLRGIGGASDGKGKGITAPNPVGQKLCLERAWMNAGLSPATATYVEGHGTSTRVGDVVEAQCLAEVLREHNLPAGSVALGSVKSNIGHLKGAAGAAGILKATLSLHEKVIPPSVNCDRPNPDIDFQHTPLYVNGQLQPWTKVADGVRRAGVSAFGFGGTNFHTVLEEYIPHRLTGNGKHSVSMTMKPPSIVTDSSPAAMPTQAQASGFKAPLRGALVIGAENKQELARRVEAVQKDAAAGKAPAIEAPAEADLRATERIAIDYADAADLADKAAKTLKALAADQAGIWKALRAQGIYRGTGPAQKVAFLYTGQGSQYVNMLQPLRALEPIVASTFEEADRIMTPLLGKPLSQYIFIDGSDQAAIAQAEADLRQTAITQPAVLATDAALTRLMAAYGIEPDMTMGHSLGEYGALVAAGGLPFADALEAVSARGREMTRVSMADNGKMAAIFAPIPEIERILAGIDGYVVIANINSNSQAVIGGTSAAVAAAVEAFLKAGFNAVPLEVSHAFHTSIVAPASEPLRGMLQRLRLQPPRLPIVANVNGDFYPSGPDAVPQMVDILARQVASPVQFVKGLQTLYQAGVRVFVEVGPKKALHGFAEDVLGERGDDVAFFTNHPKFGDVVSFNQALCGLYAAGLGKGRASNDAMAAANAEQAKAAPTSPVVEDRYSALGHLLADFLDKSWEMYRGGTVRASNGPAPKPVQTVTITGAALGLPGTDRIFDDGNIARILRGEQCIGSIPQALRGAILDKHITRLVKSDNGGPVFELIQNPADVLKLAGRGGAFDPEGEFGLSRERLAALDRVTRLAIAVGIDAMRDAGIPLVMHYKTTSKGTQLPERWGLPEAMRDDTGIIFASCWPGSDSLIEELNRYHGDKIRREKLALLQELRATASGGAAADLDKRIAEARAVIDSDPYTFDRRFIFRTLAMGHSQFAELIGARGPNTQINSACASTTQAISMAEDWIRDGRCRRVIVIAADDVTSDNLMEWVGAGFLATGAAATDEDVREAALPFDKRRHGTILGMGAAGLVVETTDAARERGIRPICEVLSAATANSAFHGTRLDVQHICGVMEKLVADAEQRSGISRREMAGKMVFVSHETYTPARGGSAAAEIHALRKVFGADADKIVIANTKGFTGHAMGAGIEDVVAVKALESGVIPPVANFREVDPELGNLNLSKGGDYPVEFALRLGAGFGSQISMTLVRWTGAANAPRPRPEALGYQTRISDATAWSGWLRQVSGTANPEVEVVKHTLRVRDGRAAEAPAEEPQNMPVSAPAARPELVVSQPRVPADPVKERVLALVAEKTGYPPDMLALDLDLEADLGVDTVKQAEVFASVREAWSIPRDESLRLRDFPTLAHVIQFVHDKRPDLAVAAVPSRVVASVAAAQTDSVKEQVLNLVCEKTGYPKDMLALDLDLEADLGVDTVKQAELFAAIRGIYNIPRDENLKLRDFPTLAHVIGFVKDRRPDLVKAPPPAEQTATGDEVREKVLDLVCEKTGYPKDMLDLDLDLEADLGVDTVKQAELFAAIRGLYDIPRDENLKLRDFPTLAHVIRFVYDKRPDLSAVLSPVKDIAAAVGAAAAPGAPALIGMTAPISVSPVTTDDPVKEQVLNLVCEKTGYPKDMLDLDLDLEADLGVDTVKQAELFAAIRGIYNIPRDESLKLREFPTLNHVIRFVYERMPHVASVASDNDPVKAKVLEIVAKQTGYPEEMLDLELDLESDLGIDTVKQAEMFASVRAAFNIPRDENLKLRDFPTLAHVIGFAKERRGSGTGSIAAPETAPAVVVQAATFEAAEQIPRRVPVPVLRPSLDLCKPTGIALGAGSRVVIAPDGNGVADELASRLQAASVEVLVVQDAESLEAAIAAGPVQGVFWLPALDDEGPISEMTAETWRAALDVRVKRLYSTMRALYEQISESGTFLVSAVRLGGQHGYNTEGATSPLGGAVTGFTKTYKRERENVLVKAVDFDIAAEPAVIAEALIAETLRDPGAVEIGYRDGVRWSVALQEKPVADGGAGITLDSSTVFVVTGAAGSIVSAITSDLAAASGGTFYLLDLVAEPDPQNADLRRFDNDKDGLKRDLAARIQARGERATPALVEKELAALERSKAALTAVESVRAAGGTVHYYSVDLRDTAAVAGVIEQVRERSSRVDVLLHAAGLEKSHFLPAKDPCEFDLVFDVKADGWFNLLHAIGEMPLGATVAFSSIAGRFGNGGQADYSSANDLLCKIASSFRTTRPETRAIAVDWTAWGGIGMATRGSIPKMMELAGIDMLPPEAGIPFIRRELTAGATRGEVLVAQRLGILMNEWDTTGGLDTAVATKNARGPMLGRITGMSLHGGLRIETTLDPKEQPFLYDHRIDGKPVLPGVMGVEAFTEAASCLLPDWHAVAVHDMNFLAPFKFYRDEPRTVTIDAMLYADGVDVLAACRLIGVRQLAGQTEPQVTTYFTGTVRLSKSAPEASTAMVPQPGENVLADAHGIYQIYFHGPAFQVLDQVWRDGDTVVGAMAVNLPEGHRPAAQATLAGPRHIELCLQTAGIAEIDATGVLALPQHLDSVSIYRCPETCERPFFAVVKPAATADTWDAEVIDASGVVCIAIRGYRTVALPGSVDTTPLKTMHALVH